MIVFEEISYKNFFASGNYPITIKLNETLNTLIIGQNGAGKSTFCGAVCYALYGEPYKKVLKGSMINSINKKEMLVEIKFSVGDKKYHIKRGMKPNIFEVYENGKLIDIDGKSVDYQEYLDKYILKMSFHTFKQIVIIGNSGFTPFLKLPAAQRREMIEDILDLGVFTKMNVLLKNDLAENKRAKDDNEKDLFRQKTRLEAKKEKIAYVTAQAEKDKNIEEERQRVEKEIKDKEALLAKIPVYVDYEKELTTKQENLIKVETKLSNSQIMIKMNVEELSLLKNHDDCPKCKQPISEDFKCESIENLTSKNMELANIVSKAEHLKNVLKQQIIDLKAKIDKQNQYVTAAEKLKGAITSLKQVSIASPQIEAEYNISDLEQEKDDIVADIESLEIVKSGIFKNNELLSKALLILKDNGVKSKIIKTYIPLMNQYINEYLEQMNYYVLLEIDENFDETIKSRHRDVFKYDNFSDGEKSRIDLSFLFAWRKINQMRNGISTNLLILDEVFSGSLDAEGIDDLNMILRNLDGSNVFVITHRLDSVEKFETVLEFKKIKNFSTVNRVANDLST